jgi:hypothetical protein
VADETPARSPLKRLRDLHTEALDRFKAISDAESAQRKRELDDLRFVDLNDQWPEEIKALRGGQAQSGNIPAVPARPMLTVNQLKQPAQQISNQQRVARLSLEFVPNGNGATRDIAQAFEDIARRRQAESRAGLARAWAFDRAAKAGRGYYRIATEYASATSWDLDLVYKRVLNGASVYLDHFAQEPDWSDAEFCFITADLSEDAFKRKYPKARLAAMSGGDLMSFGNEQPNWLLHNSDNKPIFRISEYYFFDYRERVLVLMDDGAGVFEDEIQPDQQRHPTDQKRTVKARQLMWGVIDGDDWLEAPVEQDGDYIPIIPVIGNEYNIGGDRVWDGMVRPARGAQMSYNVMRSEQITMIGTGSKAPYILDPEQIEPYRTWWEQANNRLLPYLPRRTFDQQGRPYATIDRNSIEPPIQAVTLAAHEAKDDIHATTGVPPVALGQLDPHDRSGKAIRALQGQAELTTSGYEYNLTDLSMSLEGKIMRNLIPIVYDRPGRQVGTKNEVEEDGSVIIGHPFMEKGGEVEPVPGWQLGMPIPQGAKYIDLKQGDYSVMPVTGKSYATRRQEAAAAIAEVMNAAPMLAPIIAPFWLDELDYPGAKKIAEIAKKTLPPNLQPNQGGEPDPQQLQQQLEAAMQQHDLLVKELNAKNEIIDKDVLKYQADLEKARDDNQTRIKVAEISASASLEATHAKIDAERTKIEISQLLEQFKLMSGQAAAAGMQARDHGQAQILAENQLQAQAALTDTQHRHEADMQQAQAEQAQQAAKQAAQAPNGGGQ